MIPAGRAAAAAFPPRQPQLGELRIWLVEQHAGPVVHLEGDLDLAGTAALGAMIEQVRRTSTDEVVVVDATELRFIDLAGYRALRTCLAPRDESARTALLAGAVIDRLEHLVDLAAAGFDHTLLDLTIAGHAPVASLPG